MSAWPSVALGNVATINRSAVQPEEIAESDYYVGLENIERGGYFVNVREAGTVGIGSSKFRFTSNQVLFGKLRPYLAKIACPDFSGVCSTDILPISPGPDLDKSYLRWFLVSPDTVELATTRSKGANLPRLAPGELAKFLIPLPPVEEQRRIARLLDHVDALRARRRQAMLLLDDLAQAMFLDVFGDPARNPKGWPMKRVGDLIESASYGTSAKASEEGDIPVLRMGNVTSSGQIDLGDLKFMNRASVDEKYLIRRGDVLFNRTNSADLVGKTAIYRGDEGLAFAGYLVRVRMNKNNDPEYLSAFLNTRYAKRVLRAMCKSIVGMANINAQELRGIDIAEPPLSLQEDFAKRINDIDSLRGIHSRHLAELDALFASLRDRAFRGDLWPDEAAPAA